MSWRKSAATHLEGSGVFHVSECVLIDALGAMTLCGVGWICGRSRDMSIPEALAAGLRPCKRCVARLNEMSVRMLEVDSLLYGPKGAPDDDRIGGEDSWHP